MKEEARLTGARPQGSWGLRDLYGDGSQPGTFQRPITGFGGMVFADGCNKTHTGTVLGTEARLRRRRYK